MRRVDRYHQARTAQATANVRTGLPYLRTGCLTSPRVQAIMTERRCRASGEFRSDDVALYCMRVGLTHNPPNHQTLQSRHDVTPNLLSARPLDVYLSCRHRHMVKDLLH